MYRDERATIYQTASVQSEHDPNQAYLVRRETATSSNVTYSEDEDHFKHFKKNAISFFS